VLIGAADDVFFQAAQESGETGASAKGYYAEAGGRDFGLARCFFMRPFGIAELISFYRKEFNTENSEDGENTEKKKARV